MTGRAGWARLAVVGLFLMLVAACGPTQSGKTASQILADSISSYHSAHSFQMSGTFTAEGKPYSLDLDVVRPNSVEGTVKVGGETVSVLQTGKQTFLKGRAYLASIGGPKLGQLVGNKWVVYNDGDLAFALTQLGSVSGVWLTLAQTQSAGLSNDGEATVDGELTNKLSNRRISFFIEARGEHYPVRVVADPGPQAAVGLDRFSLDFSQYNRDFHITAPPDFVNLQVPSTLPANFVATAGGLGSACGNYGCTLSATVTNEGGTGSGWVLFHLHAPNGGEIAHCRAPIQQLGYLQTRTVACWAYSANFQAYVQQSTIARFYVTLQVLDPPA